MTDFAFTVCLLDYFLLFLLVKNVINNRRKGRDSLGTRELLVFQKLLKMKQISLINHVFHSSKTRYHKAAYIENVSI